MKCCDQMRNDCRQGRDCPERSPIQPETIYAWIAFVIFALVCAAVIVGRNG